MGLFCGSVKRIITPGAKCTFCLSEELILFSLRTSAAVASVLAALALAGCGSSGSDSSPVTTGGQAPSMSMQAGGGDDNNTNGSKPSGPDCAGKQAHDKDYGDATVNICSAAMPTTVQAKGLKQGGG